MQVYEVLIPLADNSGRRFSRAHHSAWEAEVRKRAGGLSILPALEGQWVNKGRVYRERIRPVRIACTARIIRQLALLAKQHYRQLSVLYHSVGVATFV